IWYSMTRRLAGAGADVSAFGATATATLPWRGASGTGLAEVLLGDFVAGTGFSCGVSPAGTVGAGLAGAGVAAADCDASLRPVGRSAAVVETRLVAAVSAE